MLWMSGGSFDHSAASPLTSVEMPGRACKGEICTFAVDPVQAPVRLPVIGVVRMVGKVLHGVNVAACCGQLATAAVDIASTGGAATLISAGLSSLALGRTPDAQAELKDLCLVALHAHMAQAGLVEKVQKQIVLMLDSYLPGKTEFAAGDMQADKIAKGMRDRIAEQSQVPEYTDEATLDAYQALLTAVLTALLAPKTQSEANDAEILKRLTDLRAGQVELRDSLEENQEIHDQRKFRDMEAAATMRRHQLETKMQVAGINYAELIAFLEYLQSTRKTLSNAIKQLEEIHNG